MTLLKRQSFDTDSGAVSTTNSARSGDGWNTVTMTASGTATLDSSHPQHGPQGVVFASTGTADRALLAHTGMSESSMVIVVDVYLTANPPSTVNIGLIRNSSANAGQLQITSSGQVRVADSASGSIKTFTALSLNTHYRVEMGVTKGTTTGDGRLQAAYYSGNSTTPVETAYDVSTANTGTANLTEARLGILGSAGSGNWSWYADDWQIHNGTTLGNAWASGSWLEAVDGSMAQSADAVVLTQNHVLVVADGGHGQTADGVVLTQEHNLTVDDGSHQPSADSPTLTQVHSLVLADGSHGHSTDGIVLVQNHILVVADGSHALSSDSPTITFNVSIPAVADGSLAHTVDGGLTLTQNHVLVVSDGRLVHTADSVVFVQEYTLVVQNGLLTHSAHEVQFSLSGASYLLTPPVVVEPVPGKLRYNVVRGVSLIVTGTMVESVEFPSDDIVQAADYTFIGGHQYWVSTEVAQIIQDAGFGTCLSDFDGVISDIYSDIYGDIY